MAKNFEFSSPIGLHGLFGYRVSFPETALSIADFWIRAWIYKSWFN